MPESKNKVPDKNFNNFVYDWFDTQHSFLSDNVVKFPHQYHKSPIDPKFSNVLSDLRVCKNSYEFVRSMISVFNH